MYHTTCSYHMLLNSIRFGLLSSIFISSHIYSASHTVIVSVLVKNHKNGIMDKVNVRQLHRLVIALPRPFLIKHRRYSIAVHHLQRTASRSRKFPLCQWNILGSQAFWSHCNQLTVAFVLTLYHIHPHLIHR